MKTTNKKTMKIIADIWDTLPVMDVQLPNKPEARKIMPWSVAEDHESMSFVFAETGERIVIIKNEPHSRIAHRICDVMNGALSLEGVLIGGRRQSPGVQSPNTTPKPTGRTESHGNT